MVDSGKPKRNNPRIVISKSGFEVDLNNHPIVIPLTRSMRYISLEYYAECFNEKIMESIRGYFEYLLKRFTGATSIVFYESLNLLEILMDRSSAVTDRLLDRFQNQAEHVDIKRCRMIKSWLLWDMKVSNDAILSLSQAEKVRKWKFKTQKPYAAIREGKEGVGPLPRRDDLKLRGELRKPKVDAELLQGQTDLQARTAITIMRQLGVRAVQVSFMKLEDLRVWEHDGRRVGLLMVPEAKTGEAPRASFRKRQISTELLGMIEAAIQDRAPDSVGDWLFCRKVPQEVLPANSPAEEYWRVRALDQLVKAWLKHRAIPSCDGGPIKASPIRLRYTYATELAPKMTPIELAHALGHKDQRTIMHYYTFDEGFYTRLSSVDGATKWGLAATNFAGLLSEAPPQSDEGGAIAFGSGLEIDDMPILEIGRCGSLQRCRLYPPFSCYGCSRFQPNPDADHNTALEALVKWRAGRPSSVGRTRDPLQAQLDEVIEGAGYLVGIWSRPGTWCRI